jgi:hypothetical protein
MAFPVELDFGSKKLRPKCRLCESKPFKTYLNMFSNLIKRINGEISQIRDRGIDFLSLTVSKYKGTIVAQILNAYNVVKLTLSSICVLREKAFDDQVSVLRLISKDAL